MNKLIEVHNVTAGYNSTVVLKNVNLTVSDKDFVGIIGPNGGGKTTLLKVILGLVKPFSGKIKYYNVNDNNKPNIGYLPQQFYADKKFPISVEEVVLSGLIRNQKFFIRYSKSDRKKVRDTLEQIGIPGLRLRSFDELSGGELQRVLLARAIISSPKLLLLDEPGTYVDQRFENELFTYLKELNENMAIVVVSHDAGIISSYVKTIACVNKELHYHPSNEINNELLKAYKCPIDLITHGRVPHRVLKEHK